MKFNKTIIEDLTEEEISKLDLPFPFDTNYYEISKEKDFNGNDLGYGVFSDIFTEYDYIGIINEIREKLGITMFLNEEEAYKKLEKMKMYSELTGGNWNKNLESPFDSFDKYGLYNTGKII